MRSVHDSMLAPICLSGNNEPWHRPSLLRGLDLSCRSRKDTSTCNFLRRSFEVGKAFTHVFCKECCVLSAQLLPKLLERGQDLHRLVQGIDTS